MNVTVKVAAAAMMAAAAYALYRYATPDATGATAGDEESNMIEDQIDMLRNWPNGSGPYQATIQKAAADYRIPELVLAWLLWKESRYNPVIISGEKRSKVGAMGIAQFMPGTAISELGSKEAALDPERAIPGAARYLRKLYNSLGTWERTLAAYNWGIGNVQRKGLENAPAETIDYYSVILAKAGMENGAA